jgi:hypothetical protein
MTPSNIDLALAAANPLTARAAVALPLDHAERELVARVLAEPRHPRPRGARIAGSPLRRRRIALFLAATAAVALALTLLPSGDHGGGPSPAFAAALVRFANASPLTLLNLPDWHVVYADEEAGGFGEMHFVRGPADADGNPRGGSLANQASVVGRVASLTWQPSNAASLSDLAGGHQNAPTGLGVTARRFVNEGGSAHAFDVSAFFGYQGRVLTFRATVTSMAMFAAELRALTPVDTTTWLRAMPSSVVKTADSGESVRRMLKGIPLPAGFDAARIRGVRLVHDRYQLGAAVTGTVACMWIAAWNRARVAGDHAAVNRAIAAMATAPTWPVLHEMAKTGGWPAVLIGYARAMRRGTWSGRPLVGDVNTGLGCFEWGVKLGPGSGGHRLTP